MEKHIFSDSNNAFRSCFPNFLKFARRNSENNSKKNSSKVNDYTNLHSSFVRSIIETDGVKFSFADFYSKNETAKFITDEDLDYVVFSILFGYYCGTLYFLRNFHSENTVSVNMENEFFTKNILNYNEKGLFFELILKNIENEKDISEIVCGLLDSIFFENEDYIADVLTAKYENFSDFSNCEQFIVIHDNDKSRFKDINCIFVFRDYINENKFETFVNLMNLNNFSLERTSTGEIVKIYAKIDSKNIEEQENFLYLSEFYTEMKNKFNYYFVLPKKEIRENFSLFSEKIFILS